MNGYGSLGGAVFYMVPHRMRAYLGSAGLAGFILGAVLVVGVGIPIDTIYTSVGVLVGLARAYVRHRRHHDR